MTGPWSTSRGLRIGVPLAVVVAAVLVVLGIVHVSYTDGARPGTLVEGGSPGMTDAAHTATVQLPSGALKIEVGAVSQKAPQYEERNAADGATWVPIDWQLGNGGPDLGTNVATFQFSVVLVADGRRYDLHADQSTNAPASKYTPVAVGKSVDVVVQGGGHGLRVEVGFDGVTQTLDVDSGRIAEGRAAPFYRTAGLRTPYAGGRCSVLTDAAEKTYTLSEADHCTVGRVQQLPYVGGFGWIASASRTYLLVPMDVMGDQIEADGGRTRDYDVRRVGYRVTVDGAGPVGEILRYERQGTLGPQRNGTLVFRTTTSPRRLRITVTAETTGRLDTHVRRTFTSTREIALG